MAARPLLRAPAPCLSAASSGEPATTRTITVSPGRMLGGRPSDAMLSRPSSVTAKSGTSVRVPFRARSLVCAPAHDPRAGGELPVELGEGERTVAEDAGLSRRWQQVRL